MAQTLSLLAPHRALVDSSPLELSVELSRPDTSDRTLLAMWR
jgi:hypothetical protein